MGAGEPYFRASWFETESERIFARSWQLIGDVERVRRPSTHAVFQVGDEELVVVHGRDGEFRAFSNVCQHRGHAVAQGDGEGESLTCPYHGHTYPLSGSQAEGGRTLPPIGLRRMGPLLVVHLAAVTSSERPFGDLVGRMSRYADHQLSAEIIWDVASNWKLIVENFAECLHCATVHSQTLARRVDLDHYWVEPRGDHAVHHIRSVSPELLVDGSVGDVVDERLTYWLWPNTAVSLLSDHLVTFWVQPIDPERSVVRRGIYGPSGPTCDAITEYLRLIGEEDVAIVEAVQRNVRSMHWSAGPLVAGREDGVAQFRALVANAMRSEMPRR